MKQAKPYRVRAGLAPALVLERLAEGLSQVIYWGMKAYSQDLREKVLRAVDQGKSRREIVHMFGVCLATLKRYVKQRRETGNVLPRPIPGRPSRKFAPLEAGIVAQLKAHAHVTPVHLRRLLLH